jgi:hypothetical protein
MNSAARPYSSGHEPANGTANTSVPTTSTIVIWT